MDGGEGEGVPNAPVETRELRDDHCSGANDDDTRATNRPPNPNDHTAYCSGGTQTFSSPTPSSHSNTPLLDAATLASIERETTERAILASERVRWEQSVELRRAALPSSTDEENYVDAYRTFLRESETEGYALNAKELEWETERKLECLRRSVFERFGNGDGGEEEEVERLVAERIEVRGVRRLVFDEPTVERLYLKQAPR